MKQIRSSRFVVLAACLALLNTIVIAGTIIVDNRHPDASDANPGTREAPFLTIGAAARIAEAGDTVLVRPGLYREAVQIHHSGQEDAPIMFQSEERHQAVVSGSDLLKDWHPEEPGVWFAEWPGMRRMPSDNNAEWINEIVTLIEMRSESTETVACVEFSAIYDVLWRHLEGTHQSRHALRVATLRVPAAPVRGLKRCHKGAKTRLAENGRFPGIFLPGCGVPLRPPALPVQRDGRMFPTRVQRRRNDTGQGRARP